MPTLTLMEQMKDRASRLIPSQFTNIVEEATKESLTSVDYERTMIICDHANRNPDNAVHIIRAVRRRLDHSHPKVQYFTVLLLDALIKNCYEELHNEVASTKALQKVLVNIAVRVPTRDGEYEAKKCALTLILNMSYWFIGAKSDETKMLSKLADEVRSLTNPLVFEDIEADPTYQLKRAPKNRTQQRRQRQINTMGPNRMLPGEKRVVTAIPVYQYTGEQISGMLDVCSLLSECLNEAVTNKSPIVGNEVIIGIVAEVKVEHRKLAILISSGAELENIDVLLTVSDSQTAIIQHLHDLMNKENKKSQGNEKAEGEADSNNAKRNKSQDANAHKDNENTSSEEKKKKKASKSRKSNQRQSSSEVGEEMELNFFKDGTSTEKTENQEPIDGFFQPPSDSAAAASYSPIGTPSNVDRSPTLPNRDHSINDGKSAQDDEFDAFLNSRK